MSTGTENLENSKWKIGTKQISNLGVNGSHSEQQKYMEIKIPFGTQYLRVNSLFIQVDSAMYIQILNEKTESTL